MKRITIAIDGHSSCGKSTLAKALSKSLGYIYVDSGAMYRAVTLYFLQNKVDINDEEAIGLALEEIQVSFKNIAGQNTTFLNSVNVEDQIRSMEVSNFVSPVAALSTVRRKVVKQQREMGSEKGIVMDGRDIGTVVFKNAELKIFLTASPEIRTQRRYNELIAKGQPVSLELVRANLTKRDHIDSTRADSPLKKAEDAVVIDNSNLTEQEQMEKTLSLAKEQIRLKGQRSTVNDQADS
ncbi:MAG: cytidylate kinase [Saprospiraceae bacterium]